MPRKTKSIPVNAMAEESDSGIAIEKVSLNELLTFNDSKQAHRHDCHSFFLLEKGNVSIEIDFETHNIKAPAVIYMHPNQVHLILAFKNVTVTSLAMANEHLNPDYLKLLESITPAKPLAFNKATYSIITETAALCIKLYERKQSKLYHAVLKDSCNALVALIVSQYVEQTKPADKLSRFEIVSKAFYEALERSYTTDKRPAAYAQRLHVSVPYLNECVKNTTGHPVSHHIQQRVILEAKRLLHYSDKSVKEIAAELGYDDYPYFSRLFTKVTGMSALVFRNKNLD